MTYAGLASAVYSFTRATVAALVAQGTPPRAVQIGNEITNGLLWNGPGQPCAQGGRLWCVGGGPPAAQFARLAGLVAQGIRGVRDACGSVGDAEGTCAVAIHTDLGNHIQTDGIGFVVAWYQNLTRALGNHVVLLDRLGRCHLFQNEIGDNLREFFRVVAAISTRLRRLCGGGGPHAAVGVPRGHGAVSGVGGPVRELLRKGRGGAGISGVLFAVVACDKTGDVQRKMRNSCWCCSMRPRGRQF